MATAEAVLARARTQLGVTESPPGSNSTPYNRWYYGRDMRAPWCATFVSWCTWHEGLALPASTEKGFAYTPSGASWFQKQGRWSNTPKVGSLAFFDFPNDGVNRISHVGFVEEVRPDHLVTLEGNTDERGGRTGGKVMRHARRSAIVGFGHPAYTVVAARPTLTYGTPLEVDMVLTPVILGVPLDANGNGYADLPHDRGAVKSVTPNGADPARHGYQPGCFIESLGLQPGVTRVTLKGGKPGSRVDVVAEVVTG